MEDKHHIDFDLAAKILSGNANESEQLRFDELMQSEEARIEFGLIKQTWEATDNAPQIDTDLAWDNVSQKLNFSQSEVKSGFSAITMRIAASLLVIIALSSVYWFLAQDQLQTMNTEGQLVELTLDDGTLVSLGEYSSIEYPETFNGEARAIKLIGQGYFKVAPDKTKPFIISTAAGDVKVIGTAFEVNTKDTETPLIVEVEEGIVEVSSLDTDNPAARVTAGQMAAVGKDDKVIVEDIDHPAPFFWKDKTIRFKRTALRDVVRSLNELLKMQVELTDENIEQCELTVTFKDESPETIMEIIAATLNLNLSKEGEAFILSGEGC